MDQRKDLDSGTVSCNQAFWGESMQLIDSLSNNYGLLSFSDNMYYVNSTIDLSAIVPHSWKKLQVIWGMN